MMPSRHGEAEGAVPVCLTKPPARPGSAHQRTGGTQARVPSPGDAPAGNHLKQDPPGTKAMLCGMASRCLANARHTCTFQLHGRYLNWHLFRDSIIGRIWMADAR